MKKSVFLAILFCLCASLACAAGDDPRLPSEFTLGKKDDLSALMLSSLFGDVWKTMLGGDVASDFAGYSNLALGIFGILNLAALLYVSGMIVYVWGMAAVTTAHEGGRFGGRGFSTLWVSVRHGAAFSLTIPVYKGLSLMQIMIMACLGLSINTANIVWNYVGQNLVSGADSYAMSSFNRAARADAYEMAPLMFQSLVIENVFYDYLSQSKKEIWTSKFESDNSSNPHNEYLVIYPVNFEGNYDKDGMMTISRNYSTGFATIEPRALQGLLPTNFNSVNVKIPKWNCETATTYDETRLVCKKPADRDYQAQEKASDAMIRSVLAFCKEIDQIAKEYLATDRGGCAVLNGKECADGSKLGNALTERIRNAAESYFTGSQKALENVIAEYELENQTEWRAELADKMGVSGWENGDGESKFGWISAGVFPFVISSMSRKMEDDFNISVYVTRGSNTASFISNLENGHQYLNSRYQMAIADSTDFISSYMSYDGYYTAKAFAKKDSDNAFSSIREGLINNFRDSLINAGSGQNKASNAGVLGYILKRSEKYDPLVVLTEFGGKFLNVAEVFFDVGVVAKVAGMVVSVASKIPGLGAAVKAAADYVYEPVDSIGTAALLAAVVIGGTGIFFAYIAPVMPALFWLQAVFSWFFLVIEVMVAAPFWVCSHAAAAGLGFAGSTARKGYLMLFDVMVRPTLMVLGALIAIIASQVAGLFANTMFGIWFGGSFIKIGFIADVVYAIIAGSILYYIYYKMFTQGVLYIPRRISQWCGQAQARGLGSEEETTQQVLVAGQAQSQLKESFKGVAQMHPVRELGKSVGNMLPRGGE